MNNPLLQPTDRQTGRDVPEDQDMGDTRPYPDPEGWAAPVIYALRKWDHTMPASALGECLSTEYLPHEDIRKRFPALTDVHFRSLEIISIRENGFTYTIETIPPEE